MWRAQLSNYVTRLAFSYDHTAANSAGCRQFVNKHVHILKKLNPSIHIYDGKEPEVDPNGEAFDYSLGKIKDNAPYITFFFAPGDTQTERVTDMTEEKIEELMSEIVVTGELRTLRPMCSILDITHAYNPPRPPYRLILGPGWQYQ